jgi:hypothetical protein
MKKHIIQVILQDALYSCFPYTRTTKTNFTGNAFKVCLGVMGRLQDVAAELIEGAHGLLDPTLPYEMGIWFRTAEETALVKSTGGEKYEEVITIFPGLPYVGEEKPEPVKLTLKDQILGALIPEPLSTIRLINQVQGYTSYYTDTEIMTAVLDLIGDKCMVLTKDGLLDLPDLPEEPASIAEEPASIAEEPASSQLTLEASEPRPSPLSKRRISF